MSDRRRWLIGGGAALGAVLAALAIWFGYQRWSAPPPPTGEPVKTTGTTALDAAQAPTDVTTIDVTPGADIARGTTPMAQRVAVLGLLNKRNGAARDLTLKPGQAMRVGNAVVRLRACEQTAPWEPEHYTGAFVQLDVMQPDKKWRRVFSGWLYKERPNLNVVLDPLYDVWPKSCAMTFPSGGDATVAVADAPSSAKKSPGKADPAPADAESTVPSPPAKAPSTAPATAADNSPR